MSLARLRHANLSLLALIGAALLVRALVPAGWMPTRTADGLVIELCSGRTPGGDPQQLRAAQALLDAALAGTAQSQNEDHKGKSDTSDQPCVFAGLAHAAPPAAAPEPPMPAPQALAIRPLALLAAIGRGLPAPPPPATGPPLNA